MDLRHAAHARNGAVEAASKADDPSLAEWAQASRNWSRQGNALLQAVVAEPPRNLDDVLSVMMCLAEMRDQHDDLADISPHTARDVAEMTDIAIHNCIRALAATVAPQCDLPDSEIRDIDWSAKRIAHWLPAPSDTWSQVAADRARYEAAENAAEAAGDNLEAELQQGYRFFTEDKLMAMPAPDGAGLALKVLIAVGQDRASIPYQEAIEADARRLAGLEALS
jgi:hypothetical protein